MRFLFPKPHLMGFCIALTMAVGAPVAVVAGGQTFGQRCAKVHERDSAPWSLCVSQLSKGVTDADGAPVTQPLQKEIKHGSR